MNHLKPKPVSNTSILKPLLYSFSDGEHEIHTCDMHQVSTNLHTNDAGVVKYSSEITSELGGEFEPELSQGNYLHLQIYSIL